MRRLHQHAVTRGLLMACDEPILVEDLVMAGTLVDTDYQSHVFDGTEYRAAPTATRASLATRRSRTRS